MGDHSTIAHNKLIDAGHCVKVTAGILRQGQRVLITQRGPDDRHPLKWEFPGGKVEVGETPQVGLRRELNEELGIYVRVGDLLVQHLHQERDCRIELMAFHVHWISGELRLSVHFQYRWVTLAGLGDFDFLPADRPIIAHLRQAAGMVASP